MQVTNQWPNHEFVIDYCRVDNTDQCPVYQCGHQMWHCQSEMCLQVISNRIFNPDATLAPTNWRQRRSTFVDLAVWPKWTSVNICLSSTRGFTLRSSILAIWPEAKIIENFPPSRTQLVMDSKFLLLRPNVSRSFSRDQIRKCHSQISSTFLRHAWPLTQIKGAFVAKV